MSAGAYINRIRIQTQARNVKVQYPGGKATNFNPVYATCANNPNFEILNYRDINACCRLGIQPTPLPPVPPCFPPATCIIDGGSSSVVGTCIYDGGSSSSNYINILYGGTSDSTCTPPPPPIVILDGRTSSPNSYPIYDGESSAPNMNVIFSGGFS